MRGGTARSKRTAAQVPSIRHRRERVQRAARSRSFSVVALVDRTYVVASFDQPGCQASHEGRVHAVDGRPRPVLSALGSACFVCGGDRGRVPPPHAFVSRFDQPDLAPMVCARVACSLAATEPHSPHGQQTGPRRRCRRRRASIDVSPLTGDPRRPQPDAASCACRRASRRRLSRAAT
jgi:hypothetical protein